MKFLNVAVVACLLFGSAVYAEENLSECFQQDSISCIQMMVFRKAKSFFDQPKIDMLGGLSLVKTEGARSAGFIDNSVEIEAAGDVEARENALENFMFGNARAFLEERSLNWNFVGAARSLANAIPEDVKASVRSLVVEGRGKKKILKKILPLLGLVKLKMAGLAILLLFGIGLIAKKAILISLLSIAISGFLALKKLLAKQGGGEHVEAVPYHGGGGSGGWSSGGGGGYGGGYDSHGFGEYGAHSQPAQSIAYSGHHKIARR